MEGWRQRQSGQRENLVYENGTREKPQKKNLLDTAFSWKAITQVCAFSSPFSGILSVMAIYRQLT